MTVLADGVHLGMTVGETIISVVGLLGVLVLSVVV